MRHPPPQPFPQGGKSHPFRLSSHLQSDHEEVHDLQRLPSDGQDDMEEESGRDEHHDGLHEDVDEDEGHDDEDKSHVDEVVEEEDETEEQEQRGDKQEDGTVGNEMDGHPHPQLNSEEGGHIGPDALVVSVVMVLLLAMVVAVGVSPFASVVAHIPTNEPLTNSESRMVTMMMRMDRTAKKTTMKTTTKTLAAMIAGMTIQKSSPRGLPHLLTATARPAYAHHTRFPRATDTSATARHPDIQGVRGSCRARR